ncbi:TRNA (guanine-N(7)-)-methyltransferase [Aphelenchoides besseyi]|nr:TRNA (guanine-N(7)-)-methyltransferase [Aphelenchoides besseyi]
MDDNYEPPEKRVNMGEEEYGDHTETVEGSEQLNYSYPTEDYAKDQSMNQSGSQAQESTSSNPLEYEPVEMTQGHVLNGRSLGDFIESLNAVQPVIPDAVALHVMRKKGLTTEDPRIVRLISIATQKFISDIALDAMQLSRMKGLGQIRKNNREARYVLTSDADGMRHLLVRFVRPVDGDSSKFVVDPYLDYRDRLQYMEQNVKNLRSQVDFEKIKRDYTHWWRAFLKHENDKTRETRTKLLDLEDGLINVVKLPNFTRELEPFRLPSEDLPSSSQVNLTGTKALKKMKLMNYLLDRIFNGGTKRLRIRQAPSYRVRPAVIEGCNIPLEIYPRVSEGGDYLTNLVGVSLPSQVSSFVDRTFTFKNNFPLSFVAVGNTYRNTVNRSMEQRFNLSVLNIDQTEDAMRNSIVVDVIELHRLIRTIGLRLSSVNVSSNKLRNHEQAAVAFHDKQKREVARFSLIGTYIAERLNIQLPFKEVEKPKFPFLSCISVDLDHFGMSGDAKTATVDQEKGTGKRPLSPEHEAKEENEEPSSKKSLMELPRKKFYRQRAHANPLSRRSYFHPESPEKMNWSEYFGESFDGEVKNADIGCGYGGLLFQLSEVFPTEGSVGMEIRSKVSRFVQDKITAKRHNEPGSWQNICCIRTNTMRYLPFFFAKGQLERMFFLYPDPHFKRSKIKWRIISIPLIAQYAYVMKTGGLLYTVTDVLQYHEWILENFACSKLFTRVSDEELKDDPIHPFILDTSEEGQKVTRNNGDKFCVVYRRTDVESQFVPNLDEKEEEERDGSKADSGSESDDEADDRSEAPKEQKSSDGKLEP